MSEENNSESPAKTSRENWIKRGFLLALILAMAGIYIHQQRGTKIEGWKDDLDSALKQAEDEDRPVVVLFVHKSQTAVESDLKGRIAKPGNQKALKKGKYITVLLNCSVDSDVAKKYDIEELPTLLLLEPDGSEYNRAVGDVGETPFRQEFLNYDPEE